MVGFGSEQGVSDFEAAGIAGLFRGFQKSENAALGQKMPFPDGHFLAIYVLYFNQRLLIIFIYISSP
jgi:hypothetical protein